MIGRRILIRSFNEMISDGNDEAYNIYDKPWRSENTLSNHLYRPPKNRDNELYGDDIENIAKQKRFVPDKGFEGADASAGRGSGPVQFEKDAEDIFGIDKLLTDAKRVSFFFKQWHKKTVCTRINRILGQK